MPATGKKLNHVRHTFSRHLFTVRPQLETACHPFVDRHSLVHPLSANGLIVLHHQQGHVAVGEPGWT